MIFNTVATISFFLSLYCPPKLRHNIRLTPGRGGVGGGEGGVISWQQLRFTNLGTTRKHTQNKHLLTSACVVQVTGTTLKKLIHSCQTEQQVMGKKAKTESWRSKANKSADENCSHAVPEAELHREKRLQSALPSAASSNPNTSSAKASQSFSHKLLSLKNKQALNTPLL